MVPFLAFGSIGMVAAQGWFTTTNPWTTPDDDWSTTNLDVIWSGAGQQDNLVNVIRWFVNRVLGILALIALLVLLYAGFQMVTAAGDEEQYKSWFTMLKQAAIWLVMIWIARFVISIIFFVINLITTTSAGWWGTS